MGDHTETVQLDYDPQRITYNQLLDIFWKSHRPTGRNWSTQYKNVIFFHNEQQRDLAMASKTALAKKTGKKIKTEVAPLNSFTMAENYHQKYILKQNQLKKEMLRIYPQHRNFVNSTAVARLNGYAGRNGTTDQLQREIDSLGLSAQGKQDLAEMVRR
jgi:peptide methionine sulfoxide reductase MsrA